MLPVEVMQKAREEFLDFRNSGMSIMEMSHRGPDFTSVIEKAEADLIRLMNIPDDYSVVFMPAGATLQFSAVPLNLLLENDTADYAITGVWTKKAYEEAMKFHKVKIISDCSDSNYTEVKPLDDSIVNDNARYVFITSNNTIYGTRYKTMPKIEKAPLVADMTSDILSRKINIRDFGIIFAGAQKNIGPSGLTILIIRNDLLDRTKSNVPILLDYKVMAKNKSLYNTPPTYPIYMAGLVFDWLLQKGGVGAIEKINEQKAAMLYDYIDSSALYKAPVKKDSRSAMNVVFWINRPELEQAFNDLAEKNGLQGLAGHRSAGGFRASIYNAMPMQGVEKLIEFMKDFAHKHQA